MLSSITIRAERPEDASEITELVIRAYAAVPYSDHREQVMVERLRDGDAYLPELSLLAESHGELVGHVLLTKAKIGNGASAATTLALAPLSVLPEFQRQGVGKQLVGAAHERAAGFGFESILLVGIPTYYSQFGYQRLSNFPITLPFEAPGESCMILALKAGGLDNLAGRVRYPDPWLDH